VEQIKRWGWLIELVIMTAAVWVLGDVVRLPLPPALKIGVQALMIAVGIHLIVQAYQTWKRPPAEVGKKTVVISATWPTLVAIVFGIIGLVWALWYFALR
jgi:hypothetical protein